MVPYRHFGEGCVVFTPRLSNEERGEKREVNRHKAVLIKW